MNEEMIIKARRVLPIYLGARRALDVRFAAGEISKAEYFAEAQRLRDDLSDDSYLGYVSLLRAEDFLNHANAYLDEGNRKKIEALRRLRCWSHYNQWTQDFMNANAAKVALSFIDVIDTLEVPPIPVYGRDPSLE